MFRVAVAANSVHELRAMLREFLDEMNEEETKRVKRSQALTAPAAPLPEIPMTRPALPAIPGLPALPVAEEPYVPPSKRPEKPDLDSTGMPWDERIHAVTMAKNKDGTFRTRRGVEPAYVKQIEAELMGKTAPGLRIIQPMFNQPPPPALVPPPVAAPYVPPAPPMSVPIPPPQNLAAHTLETFKVNIVATLAQLVKDGKLTQEYIDSLIKYFHVDYIWNVTDQQMAEMFDQFCNAGLLTKVGP
jgi:hypothetical protein